VYVQNQVANRSAPAAAAMLRKGSTVGPSANQRRSCGPWQSGSDRIRATTTLFLSNYATLHVYELAWHGVHGVRPGCVFGRATTAMRIMLESRKNGAPRRHRPMT